MRKVFITTLIILAIVVPLVIWNPFQKEPAKNFNNTSMQLVSSAFQNEGMIPKKYSCQGDDVPPPLTISGVPNTAISLALVVEDPDAPGGTWIHWTAWNISPGATSTEDILRGSVQGLNSSGTTGYEGPCPPSGVHRYYFRLYALNTSLPLKSSADRAKLDAAMQGHILAQVELMGKYAK